MIVETSESPKVSVEFPPEVRQILSNLSNIIPSESPNEPLLIISSIMCVICILRFHD